MKTNFKKLALTAGVSAALAAGSMSAHAVITAVPAPAQLVPLFYYTNAVAPTATTAGSPAIDTIVRVVLPRSVGVDTVINILSGQAYGVGIVPATSWNSLSPGVKANGPLGERQNFLHWFWLNTRSQEIVNGTLPLSPDDVEFISARDLGTRYAVAPGTTGYLVLGNESAALGGAPLFQFVADAWLSTGTYTVQNSTTIQPALAAPYADALPNGLPTAVAIPVLGLADAADTTTYPTPTNNVIEAFGDPVASPIHTGIRTSSTVPGLIYRVVDIPVRDGNLYNNTLVAWADRNAGTSDIRNGLSGRLFAVDDNEVQISLGNLSLPNQLNIVSLGGYTPGGTYVPPTATTPGRFVPSAPITTGATPLGLTSSYNVRAGSVQAAAQPVGTARDGFLKFVINSVPLPTGATDAGAYSSVILFNIPSVIPGAVTPVNGPVPGTGTEFAIDTGFFTTN